MQKQKNKWCIHQPAPRITKKKCVCAYDDILV